MPLSLLCLAKNVIQEGVKKAMHFGLQECMCIHSLKRSCVTGSVPCLLCCTPQEACSSVQNQKELVLLVHMLLPMTPEKRDLGGAVLSFSRVCGEVSPVVAAPDRPKFYLWKNFICALWRSWRRSYHRGRRLHCRQSRHHLQQRRPHEPLILLAAPCPSS